MAEKILIIGATGYIGKFVAKASVVLGHPTFLLVRPSTSNDKVKAELLESLKSSGATILPGDLEDYSSLVSAIKQVDVVISTVGTFQLGAQENIIKAIKEVGTIKRFLPSEFWLDYGQLKSIHPVLAYLFNPKLEIRKSVQEAGIPYTILISNVFAGYFLPGWPQPGQFTPPRDKILIWGTGDYKDQTLETLGVTAVVVDENDIGTFTIKAAVDPKTLNKTVHIRPSANDLSLNELVVIWEKHLGPLEKTYVPEADILKKIEETSIPDSILGAIVHAKEEKYNVELEATELYPDVKYTTAGEYYGMLLEPFAHTLKV